MIILKLLSLLQCQPPYTSFHSIIYVCNSIYEPIENCLKTARDAQLKAKNGTLNDIQIKAYQIISHSDLTF